MKFQYQSYNSINPITKQKDIIYRPFIPVDIAYRGNWLSVLSEGYFKYVDALIDTGADTNLGPMDFAKMLGISLKGIEPSKIYGINNQEVECHFVAIALNIGGHIYDTHIGLAKDIPEFVLGGQGFLNHWQVKLEYAKEIELKMTS